MTAQAAKASILRTIKLNGGASYVWARGQDDRRADQYTLVFHLSYASPLALQASADYSAYIYDTQAANGQRVRQLAERGARRGYRPVHRPDLEQGPGVRGLPEAIRQVLGRLVPARTSPRWCSAWCRRTPRPRSCCAPGRSPSSSRSPRRCGPRSRATQHHHGQLALLAEPARAARHARPSACRSARRSCTRSTTAASSRRCAAPACSPAASSRPGCSGTSATCRTTPTTRPRRRRCSERPATARKKALNLNLTYARRQRRAGRHDHHQVRPGRAEREPLRPVEAAPGRPSGRRAIVRSRAAPGHLPGVLVAGLPRPVFLVLQTCSSEAQPYFNLSYLREQVHGRDHQPGRAADRDRQAAAAPAVQERADDDLQQAPLDSLYNANYQYAMLSGLRLPGRPRPTPTSSSSTTCKPLTLWPVPAEPPVTGTSSAGSPWQSSRRRGVVT